MCTYHYTVHFFFCFFFCRYNRLVPHCTVLFCIIFYFVQKTKKTKCICCIMYYMYYVFVVLCITCTMYLLCYILQRKKNIFLNEQRVGMLLQKRTDTRGVAISNYEEIYYLLTTTPTSYTHRFHSHPRPANHTHRFHPLPLATPTSC